MEKYILKEDMRVMCVGAKSFPDGIMDAFITLEKILPDISGRIFYGISYLNEHGDIIYKAAVAESFDGEAEKHGCEQFIITKGEYMTETILNWREEIESIGAAFETLLTTPQLDCNFPCVEWYKSDKEVLCMVRIKENEVAGKAVRR